MCRRQVNRNYKRVIVPDILQQNICKDAEGSGIKEAYVHSNLQYKLHKLNTAQTITLSFAG